VAYRLFFWIVLLGLAAAAAGSLLGLKPKAGLESAAGSRGISAVVATAEHQAIDASHSGRWYLLLLGVGFSIWFGLGVVRAQNVAFALAWGEKIPKVRRPSPGRAAPSTCATSASGGLGSRCQLAAAARPAQLARRTVDWYAPRHPDDLDKPCCVSANPRLGTHRGSPDPAQPQFAIPRRVIKGGSFLCADSCCRRYRPAARRPQLVDSGMSQIGVRIVARDRASASRGRRMTEPARNADDRCRHRRTRVHSALR